MKISFYLPNRAISSVDCSILTAGNPGIGGSEYLILSIGYAIAVNNKEFDIVHLADREMIVPKELNLVPIKDIQGAIRYSLDNNVSILVVNYDEDMIENKVFERLPSSLKIVIWAHNIIPNHILNRIAKIPTIKRIVNVGREQLDLYRDNKAFLKSEFIYNGLFIESKEYYIQRSQPFEARENIVTYLGSLIPQKGFHILAKAWKSVLLQYPEAQLHVIGSGKLYNQDAIIGKYGIAEEEYENTFMKYLTDDYGNILPSVKFLGKLGSEKNDILAKTKVSVPNPWGKTETFCLSAIEMQLYGSLIATKQYVGFLDTVSPYSGILYVDEEADLANSIIKQLKKTENQFEDTYTFIEENFSINRIASKWCDLFIQVEKSEKPMISKTLVNPDYNNKKWREINRRLKKTIPFGYYLPTVDTYLHLIRNYIQLK